MLKILKYNIFFLFLIFFSNSLNADIKIISWGGEYQNTQDKIYGKLYSEIFNKNLIWLNWKEKNIEEIINIFTSNSMTNNGIDIFDLLIDDNITYNNIQKSCDNGDLFAFDLNRDILEAPDGTLPDNDYITSTLNKCLIGNLIFSWNYAFNLNSINQLPNNAKDFFDTKKFPGKRGIHINPKRNIEFALIADGVKNKAVYKVMNGQKNAIQRAIAKIDKLCTDPNGGCIFWSFGSEPLELLKQKKVVMSTGWSNRFFDLEVKNNFPIQQVWNDQILDYEFFAINNHSKYKKLSLDFIKSITATDISSNFSKEIPYSPWRKSSLSIIKNNDSYYKDSSVKIYDFIPTSDINFNEHIFIDHEYWSNNLNKINAEWEKKIVDKFK